MQCQEILISIPSFPTPPAKPNQSTALHLCPGTQVVNSAARNDLVAKSYLEYAVGRCALAFCVDIQHAQDLQELMAEKGIIAEVLIGSTREDERERMLEDLRTGKIQVVVNVGVLLEGTDIPQICVILMCRCAESSCMTRALQFSLRLFG